MKIKSLFALHIALLWMCFADNLLSMESIEDSNKIIPHRFIHKNHLNQYIAAKYGDLKAIVSLVKTKEDAAKTNKWEETPIFIATSMGHLEIVQYLAKNFPDTIHIPSNRGLKPLFSAANNGYLEIIQCLIANGANPRLTNDSNETPLIIAAGGGHLKVVQYLADNFPDTIHVISSKGWTALNSAAKQGSIEVVKYLLDKGADAYQTNDWEETPIFIAANKGHLEIVQYLAEKFPDTINIPNKNGWTPIASAQKNGHLDVVEYLKSKGVIE